MDSNSFYRHSRIETLGPAEGGLRWRTCQDDLFEICRLDKGLIAYNPDDPYKQTDPGPAAPEPATGSWITSSPPLEARAGGEYRYPAHARDANTTGFTWYFEKYPPGMTVDRHSGEVAWIPAEGGYVEVTLCARSLYGAVARQTWTICVRKAAVVRTERPNHKYQAYLRKRAAVMRLEPGGRPLRLVWRHATRDTDSPPRTTAPPGIGIRSAMPLRI